MGYFVVKMAGGVENYAVYTLSERESTRCFAVPMYNTKVNMNDVHTRPCWYCRIQ